MTVAHEILAKHRPTFEHAPPPLQSTLIPGGFVKVLADVHEFVAGHRCQHVRTPIRIDADCAANRRTSPARHQYLDRPLGCGILKTNSSTCVNFERPFEPKTESLDVVWDAVIPI